MLNKKITVYVRNANTTPSSYYRLIQYMREMESDITIRNISPDKIYKYYHTMSNKIRSISLIIGIIYYLVMLLRVSFFLIIDYISKPDTIVLSKTFLPKYTPYILNVLINMVTKKINFIWDFDDHIFQSGEISKSQAKVLMKNSSKIIVTNEFLKQKVNSKYHDKVILLPTTDGDLQNFSEKNLQLIRKESFRNSIKLVWVATSPNIPHLESVLEELDKAAHTLKKRKNKRLILVCVCNRPVEYSTNNLEIINLKWTRELAKDQMYSAHIGIMPLINNEQALGKGGFKLVQYISTCLPVIGSNVGYNSEVIDRKSGFLVNNKSEEDEWINAILYLSSSFEVWKDYSESAYINWSSNFSFDSNLNCWKKILENN